MAEVKIRFNRAVEGWPVGAVVVVEETRRVQNMARRGLVQVVERLSAPVVDRPAGNASREAWLQYAESLGVPVWEGARRGDIIADIEALQAGERTTVVGHHVPEGEREQVVGGAQGGGE